ncbi:hypothetical protein PF005_g13321 [Phytophthora fragariae]|uniref:Uncharacterized protein n=1 Tax=Phytophthora fragariae TaxID=53985 RepID=A0A6A3JYZ4_9STRA|nr:hypothetical protein PF003_g28773 [Phytophthora fragariae]KAE8932818.1 hypothetical protein PF009_g17162 [Phytophthora fragariae]KAE9000111.1 hypothetical protein PF011_g14336 [Phytophthora fragariae]KAE9137629.1 hypothetical protein PF006_g14137 [Phytophthora fragariae]KAE9205632.1 hypothetical protein PF005_g13321 [Phytophthora fragariae]
MCNGLKSNGEKCGRKAEWCFQRLNQKPVETPVVVDQKNEEPELIEGEEKIVATDSTTHIDVS